MKITLSELTSTSFKQASSRADTAIVLLVGEDLKLSTHGQQLDKASGGMIKKALSSARFKGKRGQFFSMIASPALGCARIVLTGLGKAEGLTALEYERLGGGLVAHLNQVAAKSATLITELPKTGKIKLADAMAHIASGAYLRSYRFDKYFTQLKAEDKPSLTALAILTEGASAAQKAFAPLEKLADSVWFTRDLVSEPANIITPVTLAAKCKELTKLGLKVEVLGEKEMAKLGMGSLLGVGQGSRQESQLVVLQWNGAPQDKKGPLAFIGKGVCFDSGGISIKPAAGMEEMKWDMAGSAVVIGLLRTLAARKAKVNVVGVVGLVENMPDGNAQRPGDVVTSMSGQTIEVINTDAEGRLVLADALWYTQKRFKPRFMIDLATLTGAIIIALGSSRAGLFSNNDALAKEIADAAFLTGEPVWRLPLGTEYDKQINSDIADMKNVGEGREAGSITAAQFLQRFVNKLPWAHLDIAGVAWSKKATDLYPKGGTAFGVRMLNALVQKYE